MPLFRLSEKSELGETSFLQSSGILNMPLHRLLGLGNFKLFEQRFNPYDYDKTSLPLYQLTDAELQLMGLSANDMPRGKQSTFELFMAKLHRKASQQDKKSKKRRKDNNLYIHLRSMSIAAQQDLVLDVLHDNNYEVMVSAFTSGNVQEMEAVYSTAIDLGGHDLVADMFEETNYDAFFQNLEHDDVEPFLTTTRFMQETDYHCGCRNIAARALRHDNYRAIRTATEKGCSSRVEAILDLATYSAEKDALLTEIRPFLEQGMIAAQRNGHTNVVESMQTLDQTIETRLTMTFQREAHPAAQTSTPDARGSFNVKALPNSVLVAMQRRGIPTTEIGLQEPEVSVLVRN